MKWNKLKSWRIPLLRENKPEVATLTTFKMDRFERKLEMNKKNVKGTSNKDTVDMTLTCRNQGHIKCYDVRTT